MSWGSFFTGLGTGILVIGIVGYIVADRMLTKFFNTLAGKSNRWKP